MQPLAAPQQFSPRLSQYQWTPRLTTCLGLGAYERLWQQAETTEIECPQKPTMQYSCVLSVKQSLDFFWVFCSISGQNCLFLMSKWLFLLTKTVQFEVFVCGYLELLQLCVLVVCREVLVIFHSPCLPNQPWRKKMEESSCNCVLITKAFLCILGGVTCVCTLVHLCVRPLIILLPALHYLSEVLEHTAQIKTNADGPRNCD